MSERRRRRELEEERLREEKRRRRIARERQRRRQVMKQRMILGAAGILVILAVIIAAAVTIHKKNVQAEEAAKAAAQKEAEEEAKKEEERNTLRMVAVGDNLIHEDLIRAGEERSWNFDFLYENIKSDIEGADLASVNQETPFVNDHEDVEGYPDFATPTEVGDALVKAGFDIVTQATEHAYDQETTGILNTVTFWDTEYPDTALLGIHKEEGDSRVQFIEKKNFKIAVMNYNCMLSENHSIPEENSYMVDLYSEKSVEEDMQEAEDNDADVKIVFLHGGRDDDSKTDANMEERLNFLAEQGVDVVISSHPHILKTYEKLDRPDGGEMLVYYSLGNFANAQVTPENLLGGMADFTIKKDSDSGEISIEDFTLVPLVMHYNSDYSECGVYKLSDYTEQLAQEHGMHEQTDEEFTLSWLQEKAKEAEPVQTVSGTAVTDSGTSDNGEAADSSTGNSDESNEETGAEE